jgi:RNA polymerase I-specific transcription initiation factor RRN7
VLTINHLQFQDLPQEIQDRLPRPYELYLKLPRNTPLKRDDVHRAIIDLAISYHSNYNLHFPGLSSTSMLIQYGKHLALPIEVIRAGRSLISALELTFQFPLEKTKIFPIDHPEILLLSVLIVVTKLCFPLTPKQSPLSTDDITVIPRLDWPAWSRVVSQAPGRGQPSSSRPDLDSITPEQIVSMTDSELDEYFSRLTNLSDKTSTRSSTVN